MNNENQKPDLPHKMKYTALVSLRIKVPLAVDPNAILSSPPKKAGAFAARALKQVYHEIAEAAGKKPTHEHFFTVTPHMTRPLLDDSAPLDLSVISHTKGDINVRMSMPLANGFCLCGEGSFDSEGP